MFGLYGKFVQSVVFVLLCVLVNMFFSVVFCVGVRYDLVCVLFVQVGMFVLMLKCVWYVVMFCIILLVVLLSVLYFLRIFVLMNWCFVLLKLLWIFGSLFVLVVDVIFVNCCVLYILLIVVFGRWKFGLFVMILLQLVGLCIVVIIV